MRTMLMAVLLVSAIPALAQPAPAIEPDAARLAAATRLVDVVLPPGLRDQMIEQTTGAMVANVGQAVMNTPQLAGVFAKEPRARPIFENYMSRQADDTRAMMREMMPGILTVMARYYARQLTLLQMDAAHDFYATPAGQQFALTASGVMADPEYGQLMQAMMAKVMARMPAQTKALTDELNALAPAPAKQ